MSVHDRWGAGARNGPGKRYEVRWREAGVQRKRRFDAKKAADTFDAEIRSGEDVPLARAARKLTVDDLMASWLATTAGLRSSTQQAYALEVDQVLQTFGGRLAMSVRASEIRAWAARPRPGASIRRRSLVTLRRAYRLAITDRLLKIDPTDGARLPKVERVDMRFLSWAELGALANAAGRYAPLVWVLGTCGLRLSEAVALDAVDVDRKRRRLRVRKSKTGNARDVPIMDDVLAMLPTEIGPLFTGNPGVRLNAHNWRERSFHEAAVAVGLGEFLDRPESQGRQRRLYRGMHPHELRHTAASLAIASGADVKAVQRMLGHASAAMTLDLYGHLFDGQLDTVATHMEEARRAAVGNVLPLRRQASGAAEAP